MVFYRKYRSQLIDELDNAVIRETLASVLKKNIPHAFLFTGPKGLGKTSTARIIAKVINCTTKAKDRIGELEPCNTCDQCLSITNGTNMDILEIDAASNRGIDEIRDLKEKIRLSPLSASKKVYIIDEVHMLTTEAFNALLKTLEEPPDHAMFILCTTESQKIPSTILSRCFHLSFHLATEEELVRAFERIVKGEQIAIDKEALQMIAQLSEGGFRDGVKLLEEVTSLAGDKQITKQLIEEKYNVSSIKYQVNELLEAFHKKNVQVGLHLVGNLVVQGVDIKYFLQSLIEELHRMLLSQASGNPTTSEIFSIEELRGLFELLSKAYTDTKVAVLPQLPLELAIISYCHKTPTTTKSPVEPIEETTKQEIEEDGEVTVSSLRKQVGTIKKIQALYGEKKEIPTETENTVEITAVELMHAPADGVVTKEWLAALWKHIIAEMREHNHTIAGVLRGCTIKSYNQKTLVIQAGYKFHKERLDDIKTRGALIDVCKILTGNDVTVEVELKS